jgi:hypothetical protein
MKKQAIFSIIFFVVAAAALSAVAPRSGLCGPGPVAAPAMIKGRDCQVLKDFFARFEQDRTNKVPDNEVKHVLLEALPDTYKEGWAEAMGPAGPGGGGPSAVTVRVLHVEGRREDKPIRALITFTLLSKTEGAPAPCYDERLAALVIRRDAALLFIMEHEMEREESRLVHIVREKEVRIGGHGLLGLNFRALNDCPVDMGAGTFLKQERVNFYLFQDNGIKFAGSVLKTREEHVPGGAKGTKATYKGAIVFKKDMKGNIVGILSPYTVAREDGRVEKGMVRYAWDVDGETFVKE